MTEEVSGIFLDLFGDNAWVATFLISMIPLIELRGAIPFGMSVKFWSSSVLSQWQALFASVLGSSIIAVLVALIFRPVVLWLDKFKIFHSIITFFTKDIKDKSVSVNKNVDELHKKHKSKTKSTILRMLAVMVFVAFPLPLTGVWTGAMFGVLMGLKFWQNCIAVIVGNVLCGLIIISICNIFPNATSVLLYVFLGLIAVALLVKIVLHFVKKKGNDIEKKGEVKESNTKTKRLF